MFEVQSPKVERMERPESENFKEIKPEGKISVEEARNYVDALFRGMEKNPKIKDIDEADCHYDDCGQLYRIGDKLVANTSYELNGYCFGTDELGRIASAEGQLHMKDRDERLPIKDSIEVIGRGDQREGDDRGHLIGDQFDGPNGLENLVPQDAEINRKDFKNFENELAGEVKAGKDVYVKIDVLYDEGSRRPTNMMVSYLIDENEGIRIFPNGPREV